MARLVVCLDCGKEMNRWWAALCEPCHARRREEYYEEKRVYRLARENAMLAARKRRHYKENRDKMLARAHCYNMVTPAAAVCSAIVQDHREERATRLRRWQQENPDKMAAYQRRWRQANPEKRAAQQAHRRARKRAAASTLTPEQLEFERRIGEATYPGEKLHLHHLVPISKGGGHAWGNIAFIPAPLNLSIGDRLPEQAYSQLAF